MGVARLRTLFVLLLAVCHNAKEAVNPSGPEYEGQSGQFTYAIFASVGVSHSKARELCSAYYPRGKLAWLGDIGLPPIRAIIDQALAFHYMNFNNFFWIDGILQDANCKPQSRSCLWKPRTNSLVPRGSSKVFKHVDTACHRSRRDVSNETTTDRKFWPVLIPNTNAELGSDEAFVFAASPGYVKAGFVCAHAGGYDGCPFGFTEMTITRVPSALVPTLVTTSDLCIV
ncbi:unnamed protein product [Mesocestoides corti]|uniref:C-type lectin domain-containing protein n=1 Tax=Mesocestoides corti TaxID=53468 RepID=A0A0R3U4Y0_MESCO|nr:unnamed protein product [Mesocestoides corti]